MAEKAKGDRAMRQRGMRKVSFWLTDEEAMIVRRAAAKDSGPSGRVARRLLLEWAALRLEEFAALVLKARLAACVDKPS